VNTPTQIHQNLREAEVEKLNADFKRRISELQLAILSGTLSDAELLAAGEKLAELRRSLSQDLETSTREQTGRRIKELEKGRKRPSA
jgi:ATP-dependent RNA circularization protein (DNA/RNA ligase family)